MPLHSKSKKRYKIPNEFGEMSDWTEQLTVWNEKFGSPAVEIVASKGYCGPEYSTDDSIIFKLKNGRYAFVNEWAPDSTYEYEHATIITGLSKEEAERYMREYIHSHYFHSNFDELLNEVDKLVD